MCDVCMYVCMYLCVCECVFSNLLLPPPLYSADDYFVHSSQDEDELYKNILHQEICLPRTMSKESRQVTQKKIRKQEKILFTQSINQSTNQSINQSINQ